MAMKKIYSVWIEDSDEATDGYLETIEEAMEVCKDLGWEGYSSVIEEIDEKTHKTLGWYDADGNPLKD
jgi:hypothetical protein